MKQKLKMLFVFAAVICLSFIFSAAANADTVITAEVIPETYDSIRVDFRCGASYMTSTQFYVSFDADTLKYVSVETLSEKDGDFGTAKLVENGKLLVSFFASAHAFNNDMLTLHFDLINHKATSDFDFSSSFLNLYVSKDNSGADSAVTDDAELIWNVYDMIGLSLSVPADALIYDKGEAATPNLDGLTIYGMWPNEHRILIPSEVCTIDTSQFNGNKNGIYNITVSYRGFKTSYSVAVGVPTPESLRIEKNPNKMSYKQDSTEDFDTTGLVIVGYYPDQGGLYEVIDSDEYTITGFDTSAAPGKQTITFSYFGVSVSLDITITEHNPDKIVIEKLPDSLTYKQNATDSISLDGIVVKAHFDGGKEIRTLNINDLTVSGFNPSAEPGKQTITITYRKQKATFDITLESAIEKPVKIEIVSKPIQLTYVQNSKETFVSTGLKVNAVYADGREELIRINDLKIEGFNTKSAVGTQTITVRYYNCSDTFEIRIEAPTGPDIPRKIEITKLPDKLIYEQGTTEKFDLTGMQAVAIFEDENGKKREETVVLSDVKVEDFNTETLGWLPVYISYKGCMTVITVNIVEATVKYMLGDVNNDGDIGTADARLALRMAVGLDEKTPDKVLAADINKNELVETSDARMILRAAVGLEDLSKK